MYYSSQQKYPFTAGNLQELSIITHQPNPCNWHFASEYIIINCISRPKQKDNEMDFTSMFSVAEFLSILPF